MQTSAGTSDADRLAELDLRLTKLEVRVDPREMRAEAYRAALIVYAFFLGVSLTAGFVVLQLVQALRG